MRWLFTVLVVLAVLAVPETAWAWGPFTHLCLAQSVAQNAAVLPPALAQLITSFTTDFFYGSVAADIVVAKNLATYVRHAHNWKNGLRLFDNARTDGQRAYALGYLAHLAADTVAHNYFIPLKLVESFPSRFLRHTYWELRFDQRCYPAVADAANDLMRRKFPDNDALHQKHIAGTIFGFRTNKLIFDSVFVFQNLRRWQAMFDRIDRRSPWALSDDEREELREMSRQATVTLLSDLHGSPIHEIDPRGIETIAGAKHIRWELRRLLRRGVLEESQTPDVAEFVRPYFRAATQGPFSFPGVVPLVMHLRELEQAGTARGGPRKKGRKRRPRKSASAPKPRAKPKSKPKRTRRKPPQG